MEWIKVENALPKTQQMVLIRYATHGGWMRTTMGWHCPAKTVDCSEFDGEVDGEYDGPTDTYYLSEGWRDESQESEYHYDITGVTHWMPLPKPPQEQPCKTT